MKCFDIIDDIIDANRNSLIMSSTESEVHRPTRLLSRGKIKMSENRIRELTRRSFRFRAAPMSR